MAPPVSVVVFDVNETLSDMSPMAARFADVGLPPEAARTWFAAVLRDGFALAACGDSATFAALASDGLARMLAAGRAGGDVDAGVDHVMEGFAALGVHPDVVEGVEALHARGLRLVTLSNGSTTVAETLLAGAGIRDRFERLMSVEGAGIWKPAAGSYLYAAGQCGVEPAAMLLVAVHPWDVHGAIRAGLGGAWLDRDGAAWPAHFGRPDHRVRRLGDLVPLLAV